MSSVILSSQNYVKLKEKNSDKSIYLQLYKAEDSNVSPKRFDRITIGNAYESKEEAQIDLKNESLEFLGGNIQLKSGGPNQEETFFKRASKNLNNAKTIEVDKIEFIDNKFTLDEDTRMEVFNIFKDKGNHIGNTAKKFKNFDTNEDISYKELKNYFDIPGPERTTEQAFELFRKDDRFSYIVANHHLNHEQLAEYLNKVQLRTHSPSHDKITTPDEAVDFLIKKTDDSKQSFSRYLNPDIIQDLHLAGNYEKNKEKILEIIKDPNESLLIKNREFSNNKELMIDIVKHNHSALEYCSKELKADKEVVLEAVKKRGLNLQHASKELKADKEIVLEAVKQYWSSYEFASEEIKYLCEDKNPIETLEKAIAYDKLKEQLKPKHEMKNTQQLKI